MTLNFTGARLPVGYIFNGLVPSGDEPPRRWLPLNGQRVSALEYPELAEVWPPAPGDEAHITLPNYPGSWVKAISDR